jgi:hypothetical protein
MPLVAINLKGGNYMLVQAFKEHIFPYMVEIAVILFVFSLCQSGYILFRSPNYQQFIDRLKACVLAYLTVKGSFQIVSFCDKALEGIK